MTGQRSTIGIAGMAMVVIIVVIIANRTTSTGSPGTGPVVMRDSVSVSGLSLCASNCGYPSPYLSGTVFISGTTPLSKLQVYVNGTSNATPIQNPSTQTIISCVSSSNHSTCSTGSVESNTMTSFAILYKGSIPNELRPAVVGDRYMVTFVATFQDGTSTSTTIIVVAE